MKTIVITGSTRGIGYGLADSFLALGCAVTVSGRTQEGVDGAVATLSAKHEAGRVMGHPCDVTHYAQVQTLWDAAHAHWGRVDVWINNAGCTHLQAEFWELEPEQIKAVVDANLLGAMYGSKVALRGMLEQGSGSLYSMEGLGSTGRKMDGLAVYGTTKCGLRYLNESLAHEVRETPVLVGALRPGMVVTDLLTGKKDRPEDWERAKRIFNILADRVETVTPWLAQKVLANDKNGVCISWTSRRKIMWRFLTARFRKRDLFNES